MHKDYGMRRWIGLLQEDTLSKDFFKEKMILLSQDLEPYIGSDALEWLCRLLGIFSPKTMSSLQQASIDTK